MTEIKIIMDVSFDKINNTYCPAGASPTLDIILLYTTPKHKWGWIETHIEEILSHEVLHLALNDVCCKETSKKLDSLIKWINDFCILLIKMGISW